MTCLLAIDTSTTTAALAVVANGVTLAEHSAHVVNGHGAELVPLIVATLRDADVPVRTLNAVAVAVGPGTFTGIRVGMAAAKGLALALGIPLVGISALAALAMRGVATEQVIAPLLDARRGEMYAAAYAWSDGALQTLVPESVATPAVVVQQLLALGRPVICLGDGALRYAEVVAASGDRIVVAADPAWHLPSADGLARLALQRLANREQDDVATLAPRYLRASYAEGGGIC
ncbi:MAG: tRNA (adenosine(37)-N6)-threonylcarbamoyltransferase complex dimerization subunit type 1 TsaB [Deltaproteobacteria bacterium]|nr:tRNA (adenosine(37)-N6)-threonylcarbamoyltransferase complex dimerization subunit type 1 TsaB [Deltaproteobacteria bacterium]